MEQRSSGGRGALSGQVAIVTGGGRGVGRAIATGLAAAGASVALAARTAAEVDGAAHGIAEAGGRALAVSADVTDEAAVDRLVRAVRDELGSPTLLVNNAGVWGAVGPVQDADVDLWWRDVEVSLRGTFLCTRATLPSMLDQGGGRIVNVASQAGTAPRPNASAYAAAKVAVLSFTGSVAAEVGPRGVKVFAITPGYVRTSLTAAAAASLPELASRDDDLPPSLAAHLVVDIAAGRLDPLTGSFLHVLDDLDEMLAAAPRQEPAGAA